MATHLTSPLIILIKIGDKLQAQVRNKIQTPIISIIAKLILNAESDARAVRPYISIRKGKHLSPFCKYPHLLRSQCLIGLWRDIKNSIPVKQELQQCSVGFEQTHGAHVPAVRLQAGVFPVDAYGELSRVMVSRMAFYRQG